MFVHQSSGENPAGGGEDALGKQQPLDHAHQLPELGLRRTASAVHGQEAHRGDEHRRQVQVAAPADESPGLVPVEKLEDAAAALLLETYSARVGQWAHCSTKLKISSCSTE